MPPPASKMPANGVERRRTPRNRSARATPPPAPTADVTAVLVSHDGAAWLPEALSALSASTLVPMDVVCVDTGSIDGSAELLQGAYGQVLRLPRDTGFGAAVAAALTDTPSRGWVWLLHDDCAVEPTTLEALLAHAEDSPSAGILGPKVRDWHDVRVLVEVGVTTDAAGHRETGLERREYDQGQHDAVKDVLAVGTAGALVRRQLWDDLHGLDPLLPVFRDDLDLGWRANAAGSRVVVVPQARVRHVRAATTGRRSTDAAPGRATGTDRRNALFVLLAHASLLRLLGLLPRLLVATAVRALVLLLTRQLPAAADEVRALVVVLARPGRLHAARRARSRTRTASQRELSPLFAARTVRLRARVAAAGDWLSGGGVGTTDPLGALGDPGPDGPDGSDDLSTSGSGALRSLLLRPGVLLVAVLALVALLAERAVLATAGGRLAGGQLLPAPAGARDLWASYAGTWHEVSVGSGAVSSPGTAVLALVSTLLLGKPWLAVDVLLLASVPLAGLMAYVAAGRVVRHLFLRLWAAATWALLPAATGAIATGRLGTAALQVGLPLLLLGAGRLLSSGPHTSGWAPAWAVGLGLAVLAALSPLLWPLSAATLLVVALARVAAPGGLRRLLAALIVTVVPLAVLLPWSLSVLAHPSLLLASSGSAVRDLPGWQLLLLSPGGPGLPVALATVGLLLAAVGGTVRRDRRPLALGAWAVALLALATAAVLVRVQVRAPGASTASAVQPSTALQVAAGAMLVAALVGADQVRSRLAESEFGWRQLLAGTVAVVAAVVPLVTAVSWMVRGADSPLSRDLQPALPAFAQAELDAQPGLRVLVLVAGQGGRLAYDVTGARGALLQDAGTPSRQTQTGQLDAVVADLLTPRGSDAAEALSTRAVRYVALRESNGTAGLADVLDAQAGLVRRAGDRVVLWQVVAPSDRLSVLPPALATAAVGGARAPQPVQLRTERPLALPAGREAARTALPAGPAGRLLVLAEAQDRGWHASLDGRPLPRRTAWGWAQGFELPSSGGRLVLVHEQAHRHRALLLEGLLLLVVIVLSVPGRRARTGLEDDLEDA